MAPAPRTLLVLGGSSDQLFLIRTAQALDLAERGRLVLKPVDRSGSRGVLWIADTAALGTAHAFHGSAMNVRTIAIFLATGLLAFGCKKQVEEPAPAPVEKTADDDEKSSGSSAADDEEWTPKPVGTGGGPSPSVTTPGPTPAPAPAKPSKPKTAPTAAPSTAPSAAPSTYPWLPPSIPTWPWAAPDAGAQATPDAGPKPAPSTAPSAAPTAPWPWNTSGGWNPPPTQ